MRMEQEVFYYYDFDLTLGIKKNNQNLLNQALVDLAVSQHQHNTHFKIRGLTSYFAFQALKGEYGSSGAIGSGHSRSHIISSFEKTTGFYFDALITSASPVLDGPLFGQHGRAMLGYEAKVALDLEVHTHHFKNSLVDTQTLVLNDLEKFEQLDKAAGHIISYVIKMVDDEDPEASIAQLLKSFFAENGANGEFPEGFENCKPYLGIPIAGLEEVDAGIVDTITKAARQAIDDYLAIPWPQHMNQTLRKRCFVEGKGAMLLHALRQHKAGDTVCIFDDKYQVLRMLDILRTMDEFKDITIKGIQVEARSPSNQKSYYEQILAQSGSFVCYNTEVDYLHSDFKNDFEQHALTASPVKPQKLEGDHVRAHFFGAMLNVKFKRWGGDPNTTLFDRVTLSWNKVDWHCLLASIVSLHQRIVLPIEYQGIEATLIYDHLSAAWYLTTHNRQVHKLCQHLMDEAYAGIASFQSHLEVSQATLMLELVHKMKQQYIEGERDISAILDLKPFTWRDSFIAARELVFDEKDPQQIPLKQLVFQVLTGFIVLRLVKTVLRFTIEMPIRAVELKLADWFERSGYDLASSPKLNALLRVISLPRLFLRAVISPKLSWDMAAQVTGKWQRRGALAATITATAVGWGLLTFVALPAVLSVIPGALSTLQPLLAPIANGLGFRASIQLFSLAVIVGTAAMDYFVSPLITKSIVSLWRHVTKPSAKKVVTFDDEFVVVEQEQPTVQDNAEREQQQKAKVIAELKQHEALRGRKPSDEDLEPPADESRLQPEPAPVKPSETGIFGSYTQGAEDLGTDAKGRRATLL